MGNQLQNWLLLDHREPGDWGPHFGRLIQKIDIRLGDHRVEVPSRLLHLSTLIVLVSGISNPLTETEGLATSPDPDTDLDSTNEQRTHSNDQHHQEKHVYLP